ncbi:MAG: hypothetical protein JSU01_13130 [Bacteroidetes bacterium]|nr:hypothetical protein [Bacteroidota bacterium]
MAINNITNYLKSSSAEDLKGLEINISTKYTYKYIPMKWALAIEMNEVAFVEITTRSGHGAAIKYTPGLYLYKPLALSWPKQFYRPKYTIKDTIKQADLRSTIDWEPNITTDSAGHAMVSFYAAGNPSTYTVIVEGTDLKGNVAYKRRKIKIVLTKGNEKSK